MTLFSLTSSQSIISFILLFLAFLLSIGISGMVSAYIKYFIGDNTALEEGYGNPNPFIHIDFFGIVLFLLTKIILRVRQPFNWNWKDGINGIFQRLFFLLGTTFFHIFFAILLLIIGIYFWSSLFLILVCNVSNCEPSKIILLFKTLLPNENSLSIISILFLAHLTFVNIGLSLFEFLNKTLEYVIYTYVVPYMEDRSWLFILAPLSMILIFYLFEHILWKTIWKIIIFFISIIFGNLLLIS